MFSRMLIVLMCLFIFSSCAIEKTPYIEPSSQLNSSNIEKASYDMLYPIKDGDMYGFIDKTGNVVITPQYEYVGEFSDGFASVKQNGLYGYIDLSGEIVIPLIYKFAGDYSNGLVAVAEDELSGYINIKGELVIGYKYEFAMPFCDGVAKVIISQDDNMTSYIDLAGNTILCVNTRHCGPPNDGIIRIYATYYDTAGNELFSDWFDRNGVIEHSPDDFSEGLSVYPVLKKEYWDTTVENWTEIYYDWSNWEYIYRDKNGEQVLDVYDYAESFSEGLAIVKKDGEHMVIDKTGAQIFKNNNLKSSCQGGFFIYEQESKFGFINKDGDIAIVAQYDEILKPFKNGLSLVKKDNKEMYINKMGEIIWSQN